MVATIAFATPQPELPVLGLVSTPSLLDSSMPTRGSSAIADHAKNPTVRPASSTRYLRRIPVPTIDTSAPAAPSSVGNVSAGTKGGSLANGSHPRPDPRFSLANQQRPQSQAIRSLPSTPSGERPSYINGADASAIAAQASASSSSLVSTRQSRLPLNELQSPTSSLAPPLPFLVSAPSSTLPADPPTSVSGAYPRRLERAPSPMSALSQNAYKSSDSVSLAESHPGLFRKQSHILQVDPPSPAFLPNYPPPPPPKHSSRVKPVKISASSKREAYLQHRREKDKEVQRYSPPEHHVEQASDFVEGLMSPGHQAE